MVHTSLYVQSRCWHRWLLRCWRGGVRRVTLRCDSRCASKAKKGNAMPWCMLLSSLYLEGEAFNPCSRCWLLQRRMAASA